MEECRADKIGPIFQNKSVQKCKLSKIIKTKSCSRNLMFKKKNSKPKQVKF